jgi:hypothetical protein
LDFITALELKESGRIFGSICFNSVNFIDHYLLTLSKHASRFEFGIHKLTLKGCYITKANLRLLLSYIQKSVETLFVNCDVYKKGEEMVETLPALKFKRLKKLTIGKIKNEESEELFTSVFQHTPVLENLKIYNDALGVINGKTKLKKLTLCNLECE